MTPIYFEKYDVKEEGSDQYRLGDYHPSITNQWNSSKQIWN